MSLGNASQTEVVNDIPSGTREMGQTEISLRPVRFNGASVWESPFFWMFVGVGLTMAAIWAVKKKL